MTTVELERLELMKYANINWDLYQDEESKVILSVIKITRNLSLLNILLSN